MRGSVKKFQKLSDLEFDSYRKCMSVIVRSNDEDGELFVFTKGIGKV